MVRFILLSCAVILIFLIVLAYNWTNKRDWDRFVQNLKAQIKTTEQSLSTNENEEATLAKNILSAASNLLVKQQFYETRMVTEEDEKLRAVWGSYKLGFALNRHELLKMVTTLDALRDTTRYLRNTAIKQLEFVQGIVSHSHDTSPDNSGITTAEEHIAHLNTATALAIELFSEAKNEIAEQQSSLKEQQRKIQGLVPVGASTDNPVTKEIMSALDSALRENEKVQELLHRFDESVTSFGKAVFSIRDLTKDQTDFLHAVRISRNPHR